jgi:hypothetical protein
VIPPEVFEWLDQRLREIVDERLREILPAVVREVAGTHPEELELLTYARAAERLSTTYDGVRMLVQRRRLDGRKIGRRAFVTADSIRRLEGRLMVRADTSMAPARQPPFEARPQEEQFQ